MKFKSQKEKEARFEKIRERKKLIARRKIVPAIVDTEKFILQTIKGQDEQVRRVVTAAYRSAYFADIKANVLIIGGSGTGKSEIMRQLAESMERVFVTVDANEFTQEGYEGKSVSTIARDLVFAADFDFEKAQKGIVFIDEIDKKAAVAGEAQVQRDISGKGVLNSLLKLIEGKKLSVEIPLSNGTQFYGEFDTSHLIIFFAGAFSGIEEIKKKKVEKNKIGFSTSEAERKKEKAMANYTKSDLIDYGLTEEFVGRIDTIVQMNELSEEVLEEILKTSKKSVLRAYSKALRKRGVKLTCEQGVLREIAQKAHSKKTGARELSNVVNYIFEKIMYEVMASPKSKYSQCILLKGIEHDNTKYILK